MINCNYCKHLNITEEQQQTFKYTPHICMKHGVKLFHMSSKPNMFHDHINPCRYCDGRDFEQR